MAIMRRMSRMTFMRLSISHEAETGSREETASKQNMEPWL